MGILAKEIKNNIEMFRTNPAAIQRYVMDLLSEVGDNEYTLENATSPFVFLLEATSMMCSSLVEHSESIARKLYPQMATTVEDLYRHMADVDYLNRFARPSKAAISLVILKRDIVKLAVSIPFSQQRKIIIPRETEFNIAGHKFGIFYPIDIYITANDALKISYSSDEISPLLSIANLDITWTLFTHGGIDYIYIDIPVYQFTLAPHRLPVNVNIGLDETISFTGKFYYARVYHNRDDGWAEMQTTHSTDVYDVSVPTAILSELKNALRVVIPQIYFYNSVVGDEVRVDIYTTEGEISLNLGNYSFNSYSVRWRNFSGKDAEYNAPLGKLSTVTITSKSVTSGGGNGITYEQLRDRVITSRHRRDIPVSYNNLTVTVQDLGYTLIKSIDDVTSRIYHMSRSLPPVPGTNDSPDGLTGTVELTDEDLSSKYIYRHEFRYILLPGHLYEMSGDTIKRLTDEEHDRIIGLDNDAMIDTMNARNILYQCLHYVIDESDNYVTINPYSLNSPLVTGRWIKAESTTAPMYITSDIFSLKPSDEGYALTVRTKSSDNVKDIDDDDIHAQLAFIPYRENRRTYLLGEIIGTSNGERIFRFNIKTGLDIDRNDIIRLEGFTMHVGDSIRYGTKLNGDYELIFSVSNQSTFSVTTEEERLLNESLGRHQLPNDAQAITNEHMGIKFGEKMDLLLSQCRVTIDPETYLLYSSDVPSTYAENIYERNDDGNLVLVDDPDTGRRVPVLIRKKGDVVLDNEGNVVYKFKKGDVKHDDDGNPIVSRDRGISRLVDILLVDGIYRVATSPPLIDYYARLPTLINDYLLYDIKPLSKKMLERTEIYYSVKRSIGNVDIILSNTSRLSVSGSQAILIIYYVESSIYDDSSLRESIVDSTKSSIFRWLNNTVISTAALTTELYNLSKDSILGVDVKWIGQLDGIDTFTIDDNGSGISIARKLTQDYDGTLIVVDDVDIEFIRQDSSS